MTSKAGGIKRGCQFPSTCERCFLAYICSGSKNNKILQICCFLHVWMCVNVGIIEFASFLEFYAFETPTDAMHCTETAKKLRRLGSDENDLNLVC